MIMQIRLCKMIHCHMIYVFMSNKHFPGRYVRINRNRYELRPLVSVGFYRISFQSSTNWRFANISHTKQEITRVGLVYYVFFKAARTTNLVSQVVTRWRDFFLVMGGSYQRKEAYVLENLLSQV